MDIRKLTTIEERYWASLSNNLAFNGRRSMEDIRKNVEENPSAHDDWGCFTDEGRLMAHVQNERRLTMFDGNEVFTGCIGCVSTFPEYREGGAVREIFGRIFPDAYADGEVFSYLFPFNHAFYRKFGYETCGELTLYIFPISALKGWKFSGWAKLWLPGDELTTHTDLYNAFAAKYNMMHTRTPEMMKGRVYSDPFETRRYTYLLGNGESACAYITFASKRENGINRIEVQDCAWLGKAGFRGMLGFLARYSADYNDVIFRMPSDIKLSALIQDGYSLSRSEIVNGYMARVINVQKALALMNKPDGACFTIAVNDPLIPENSGTWRVCGASAEKCDAIPDITASVTALGPMLLGSMPLSLAEMRDDVNICANHEALEKIFTQKPCYIAPVDHF